MGRRLWPDLPRRVRRAIVRETGELGQVRPVTEGSVAAFAAVVAGERGTFFCKGVRAGGVAAESVRMEARVNPVLPVALAPRLRWRVDRAGWLVLGFDHVAGRHPDLAPGSTDLTGLAATLTALADELTPCPRVRVPPAAVRWQGWLDPGAADGDTLAHTDVTPRNFLIDDNRRTRVVDWSMPVRGAAWIDTARMVVRLIRAGHTPREAEDWAATIPAYASAPGRALDAFARAGAALAAQRARETPAAHVSDLSAAASAWCRYRDPA